MGEETRFLGRVPTTVALALLESLRAADTPTDPGALTETDLPLNLRRRLGLSRVVDDQIKRYAARRGDGVSAAEVASLFELISRRPDADRVFAAAGRRLAEAQLEERAFGVRVGRALPERVRERLALRRVRRLARVVSPGSEVNVQARPAALTVQECLPARAVGEGVGCSLFEGAIAEVLDAYRASGYRVVHDQCEGREASRCRWTLEPASTPATDGSEAATDRPHVVPGAPATAAPTAEPTREDPLPVDSPSPREGPEREDSPVRSSPAEANGR